LFKLTAKSVNPKVYHNAPLNTLASGALSGGIADTFLFVWWQFYGNILPIASYDKKMRTVFIILTNFIFSSTFGQAITNDNCYTDNNPKTKVTKLTYPFNKAERILIVKYKAAAVQGKPNIFSWDTVQIIPKKGNIIDTTKFLAAQQLTNDGTDSLLKIINQKSKENLAMEGIFVEPSNAIIFIDKKGNIFEYIVICFATVDKLIDHTEMTSSSKVNLGQWCRDKGKMLLNFFQQRAVDTVITKWE
jgi:hypothetical protein